MEMTVKAHAKINITLDITGVKDDGYHLLESVFQTVSLYDLLKITLTDSEKINITGNNKYVPSNENNLVFRAADSFFRYTGVKNSGVSISLEKHIPVASGLGGGSADAAAVINALNSLYKLKLHRKAMIDIAKGVGADVPFCLFQHTMLVEGTGEKLKRLRSFPDCHFVLIKHGRKRSTSAMYAQYDLQKTVKRPDNTAVLDAIRCGNLLKICENAYNVFLPLWADSEIPGICDELKSCGAICASLTGSGPTVFGIFTDYASARSCCTKLRNKYDRVYICQPF